MEHDKAHRLPRHEKEIGKAAIASELPVALDFPEDFEDIVVDTLRSNTRGAVHPSVIVEALWGVPSINARMFGLLHRKLMEIRSVNIRRSKGGNYFIDDEHPGESSVSLERRIAAALQPKD